MKLENQTAIKGEKVDFSAKTPNILSKKTKPKATAIPMVRFIPIPPLLFIEEIADALGKSVNSIRGKALSLLRAGEINAIPKQRDTKGTSKSDPLPPDRGSPASRRRWPCRPRLQR